MRPETRVISFHCRPMHFERNDELTVPPYLLGCILGDGNITHRVVSLANADVELLEECRALLPTGTDLVHKAAYDYVIRPQRDADGDWAVIMFVAPCANSI